MNHDPFAWAVIFTADEKDPVRLRDRAAIFKQHSRADQYAGDPTKPHDEPRRVIALWADDTEATPA